MLYGMANNNVIIPAERDGALYSFLTGGQDYVFEGIGNEFEITPSASSFLITLGTGEGVVSGRHVTEETVNNANSMIQLDANSSGYVVIRVDLTKPVGTEAFLYATPVLSSQDLNNGGNVHDLPLYQYTTNGTGVATFTDIRPLSSGSNVACVLENGTIYVEQWVDGVKVRKQVGSLDPELLTATPSDVKVGMIFGGSGSDDPQVGSFTPQVKTVTPSRNAQSVSPDNGYYLERVDVYGIPARTYRTVDFTNTSGGISSVMDTGNTATKTVGAVVFNCRGYIQGSNDNSNWNNIGSELRADGNNDGWVQGSMPMKIENTTYRYIRFNITWRYNNGVIGNVQLFAVYN